MTFRVAQSWVPALTLALILSFIVAESGSVGAGGFVFVKTWGGPSIDRGYGVTVDPSGNLLVTGGTGSFGSGAFLLKFTAQGRLIWQKIWTGNTTTQGRAVATDSSGAVYVVGGGGSGALISKLNSSGDALWQKTWTNLSNGNAIAIDSLDYVYVTGSSYRNYNPFLIKLSASGTTVWEREWGGNTTVQFGNGLAVDAGGAIYVAGSISTSSQSSASLLLKYNSTGSLQWQRSWWLNSVNGNVSLATSVAVAPSGSVFVVGSIGGIDTGNAAITKFASNGSLLWQRMWPATPEGINGGGTAGVNALGAAADNSGNVYVTGNDNGNAFLLKIDPNGNLLYASSWGPGTYGNGIALDHLGNPAITGVVMGPPSTKGVLPTDQTLAKQNPFVMTPAGASVNSSDASSDPSIPIVDASGSTTYAGGGDVFLNYGTTFPVPAFTPIEVISMAGLILIVAKKGVERGRNVAFPLTYRASNSQVWKPEPLSHNPSGGT